MSCSESPKPAFRLKLSQTLLSQLALFKVAPDEVAEFVFAQFHNILASKPNCPQIKGIWVVRGYYPNTPVFFKITVVKTHQLTSQAGGAYEEPFSYWVRIREHKATWRRRLSDKINASNTCSHRAGEIVVMSDKIAMNVSQTLENSLLEAEHKNTTLIPNIFKAPKCMSPKGMKLFRYKKPSNRKKRET